MKNFFPAAITHASSVIRYIDSRVTSVEKILHASLSDIEANRIKQHCIRSGRRMGHYYHWKIEQWATLRLLKSMNRNEIISFTESRDHSNYHLFDDLLANNKKGLLIATPHHGHFTLSIIATTCRAYGSRRVSIFYDPPSDIASNAIYDEFHSRMFTSGDSVSTIHNTRKGLVQAVRELRAGNIVIIMPDVYKDHDDTWLVPFLGGFRRTTLGTATLARITGATLVPMVATIRRSPFEFESRFCTPLPGTHIQDDRVLETYIDYTTTCRLFSALAENMQDQSHAWQYARSHAQVGAAKPRADREKVLELGRLLLSDPRIHVQAPTKTNPPLSAEGPR